MQEPQQRHNSALTVKQTGSAMQEPRRNYVDVLEEPRASSAMLEAQASDSGHLEAQPRGSGFLETQPSGSGFLETQPSARGFLVAQQSGSDMPEARQPAGVSQFNKLGVRHFGWSRGIGPVRTVDVELTDKVTQKTHIGIISFLSEAEMNDLQGYYFLHAARETEKYHAFTTIGTQQFAQPWEWLFITDDGELPISVDRDTHVAFTLTTDVEYAGRDPVTVLAGYAIGKADTVHDRVSLEYVETAPMFERQNVAKVLSTFVLSDTWIRGYNEATVDNIAGLPGALAYVGASSAAGFTHVSLSFLPGVTWDAIKVTNVQLRMDGKEHITIKLMCTVIESVLLPFGKKCTCSDFGSTNCFNYQGAVAMFTFIRKTGTI